MIKSNHQERVIIRSGYHKLKLSKNKNVPISSQKKKKVPILFIFRVKDIGL